MGDLELQCPHTLVARKVTDIEMGDVSMGDYPDFCDAYIEAAVWDDTGKPLDDSELEYLNETFSGLMNELAHDWII